MDPANLNYLAILVASIAGFMLGAIWFSPPLFHKIWMKANNFTDEDLKRGNQVVNLAVAFVLTVIITFNLAIFLDDPGTDAAWGATAGFLAGVWVVAGFSLIAMFERRPFTYHWVNGGYLLVMFTMIGWILGIWR